ncbi:MAG: hypothetical protein M5U19_00210 [Microthrixaceae bacterium]|nr:hypothetical protein [Microthrixaceae bacterium]
MPTTRPYSQPSRSGDQTLHWALLAVLVALVAVAGLAAPATAAGAQNAVAVINTKAGPAVGAEAAVSPASVGVPGPMFDDETSGSLVAPRTALDDLQAAANRASANVGPGRGAVHGTHVHSSFADELAALGRTDVFSEISYLNGRVVPYGTKGSVRLDAVVGSPGAPSAIYDLKTGSAALTSSRIAQIRSHLPPGFQNIPVHELRPG